MFVAWPHKSLNFPKLTQRLGIVFCANRPCFLYHAAYEQEGSSEGNKVINQSYRMILLLDNKHATLQSEGLLSYLQEQTLCYVAMSYLEALMGCCSR